MLADLIPKLAANSHNGDHPYYPRPSMASPVTPDGPGRCVRSMVYHRLNTPAAPWPGRFLLVLDDSSWHEELSIDWLQKSAYTISGRQLPVDFELPRPLGQPRYCASCRQDIPNTILHGHIDGIFTDPLGTDRLLEHKAVSMFAFDDLLAGHPPLDYLTQGCIYLGALTRLNPELTEGVLLVKNKNTSAYCEFRFTYDADIDRCHVVQMVASEGINQTLNLMFDHLINDSIAKFEQVETHAIQGTLPARPYPRDSWRCGYCRWADTCWATYDDEYGALMPTAPLPTEAEALLQAYWNATQQKNNGETIQEQLKPKILALLQTHKTKTGHAGAFTAAWTLQPRTTLDRALLPADLLKQAEVTKTVDILRVLRKESTHKKGHQHVPSYTAHQHHQRTQ